MDLPLILARVVQTLLDFVLKQDGEPSEELSFKPLTSSSAPSGSSREPLKHPRKAMFFSQSLDFLLWT